MSGERTELGRQLRAVMSGNPQVVEAGWLDRWRARVLAWQRLARRYRMDGLTKAEVEALAQEWEEKRTNMELMLEVVVRDGQWREAAREVRLFMDEIACAWAEDKAACKRVKQAEKKAAVAQEVWLALAENQPESVEQQRTRDLKKILVNKHKMNERGKFTKELSQLLSQAMSLQAAISEEETGVAMTVSEPKELVMWLREYVTEQKELIWQRQALQSLKVQFVGN